MFFRPGRSRDEDRLQESGRIDIELENVLQIGADRKKAAEFPLYLRPVSREIDEAAEIPAQDILRQVEQLPNEVSDGEAVCPPLAARL